MSDELVLRQELNYATHNLVAAALDGRYRVDSALNVLQHVMDGAASNVAHIEATPSNIAAIDRAIADVRHELELAVTYIHQAVSKLESVT